MRILIACEESQAVTKEFRALGHEEYKHIVYIHNFPNGKKYIGITCQAAKLRWRCNGSGYKTQSRIFRAIEKYGWNNIESKIIYDGLSKQEAETMEINLIAMYNSTNKSCGYNSDNGGNSKGRNSSETRTKISFSKKGKKASDEAKRNMSIAQTGRKQTDETKKKLSKIKTGIPKSEETKAKISKTLKSNEYEMERWKNILKKQRKPIIQYDLHGNEIARFDSISIAAHATCICRNNINNCCLKKTGSKTAGGYKWGYNNE